MSAEVAPIRGHCARCQVALYHARRVIFPRHCDGCVELVVGEMIEEERALIASGVSANVAIEMVLDRHEETTR